MLWRTADEVDVTLAALLFALVGVAITITTARNLPGSSSSSCSCASSPSGPATGC